MENKNTLFKSDYLKERFRIEIKCFTNAWTFGVEDFDEDRPASFFEIIGALDIVKTRLLQQQAEANIKLAAETGVLEKMRDEALAQEKKKRDEERYYYVKIFRCRDEKFWYKDFIGSKFIVKRVDNPFEGDARHPEKYKLMIVSESEHYHEYIEVDDAEIIST